VLQLGECRGPEQAIPRERYLIKPLPTTFETTASRAGVRAPSGANGADEQDRPSKAVIPADSSSSIER
jgi:hypothetical protein